MLLTTNSRSITETRLTKGTETPFSFIPYTSPLYPTEWRKDGRPSSPKSTRVPLLSTGKQRMSKCASSCTHFLYILANLLKGHARKPPIAATQVWLLRTPYICPGNRWVVYRESARVIQMVIWRSGGKEGHWVMYECVSHCYRKAITVHIKMILLKRRFAMYSPRDKYAYIWEWKWFCFCWLFPRSAQQFISYQWLLTL